MSTEEQKAAQRRYAATTHGKRKRAEANARWYRNTAPANRAYLDGIKLASGCADCGYNEDPVALQFDHVRGVKTGTVGSMVHYSRERLDAEIAKCVVRCANCHAIKTWRLDRPTAIVG